MSLGLAMIVKDEVRLIERCLDSTLGLIDYYSICDTGSEDNTRDSVRRWLERHGCAGEIVSEAWHDFGYNRSLALWHLAQHDDIDYALMLDADDVLVVEDGFDPAQFTADVYHVAIYHGTLRHARAQICRNNGRFRYRGVVHEFLDCDEGFTSARATGIHIRATTEGARSRNPAKYRHDAELIEAALKGERDDFMRRRYSFYLANSWRDAGEPQMALLAYEERAQMGGWDEEVALSRLRAGEAVVAIGGTFDQVMRHFLAAWEACPRRAEALHAAARYCRQQDHFHQGYLFSKHGIAIPQPADGLFLEPWIYQYGMLDEYAVCAYWAGYWRESMLACVQLLGDGLIPDRDRVQRNLRFAREKLNGER